MLRQTANLTSKVASHLAQKENTFYLVLIDSYSEALHSAYCGKLKKIESNSARQTAETQLAAALGLNKVAWQDPCCWVWDAASRE